MERFHVLKCGEVREIMKYNHREMARKFAEVLEEVTGERETSCKPGWYQYQIIRYLITQIFQLLT